MHIKFFYKIAIEIKVSPPVYKILQNEQASQAPGLEQK